VVDLSGATGRAATGSVVCTRRFSAAALLTRFQTVNTAALPAFRAFRFAVATSIALFQAGSASTAVTIRAAPETSHANF